MTTSHQVLPGDIFDSLDDVDETLSWEQPMQRTWEDVEEDETGALKSLRMMQQRAIKRRCEREQHTKANLLQDFADSLTKDNKNHSSKQGSWFNRVKDFFEEMKL